MLLDEGQLKLITSINECSLSLQCAHRSFRWSILITFFDQLALDFLWNKLNRFGLRLICNLSKRGYRLPLHNIVIGLSRLVPLCCYINLNKFTLGRSLKHLEDLRSVLDVCLDPNRWWLAALGSSDDIHEALRNLYWYLSFHLMECYIEACLIFVIELRCLGFKLCLHLVDVCLKQGYILIIEVCLIAHYINFSLLDHFRLLIKFDLLFVFFKLSCCNCKILLRLG